jgi:hypothetical protein
MDRTIEQRLAVIEAVVIRLEERLFGNGQPGELALLKNRVRQVESWLWRTAGAAGVVLALLQVFDHAFSRVLGR